MALTPEGRVKKKIKEVLDSYGEQISWFPPAMNGYGKAGVSDFVCSVLGIFFAIEAKDDITKKGPTGQQQDYIDTVNKSGGIAVVVDKNNVHKLKPAIDLIIEKRTKEIEYADNYLGCRDVLQTDAQPVKANPD